jgi:hypothetical protein
MEEANSFRIGRFLSWFIFTSILVFYLFNGVRYLQSQSLTSDEGAFYDYAKRYLAGNPERTFPSRDNSKTPVTLLNTIPRVIEQVFNPGLAKRDNGVSDITNGRYITLLVSVLSILLVYRWAFELYGEGAGLFAAFLTSFCPNLMASAGLVTTDSYSAVCLLATMYFFWKYCTGKRLRHFIVFSVLVAVSQLVKQSLFHLYVLIPLLLALVFWVTKQPFNKRVFWRNITIFLFINWFIINCGYYFNGSNKLLGDYRFMSGLFKTVQNILPAWLPVPLPKPFIDGLDMTKYYDQVGGGYDGISSFGKVTILGRSSTGGSFWYYYFVSLFFKTPVTALLLFVWSILLLFKKTMFKNFVARELFLLFPVVYFLITMSFFYNTQTGIRHIIFLYPFIYILSSSVIPSLKDRLSKLVVVGACLFLLISVGRYWRNYYPYTNEFIEDKKMAWYYVGAANLEFLQGGYFFREYLLQHPEVKMAPTQPAPGIYLINTADYLDVWNKKQYTWLAHLKPFGVVAYNGLLIKVTEKDLKK